MPSGGFRPGAGRPKGERQMMADKLRRLQAVKTAEQIVGQGMTPLGFLMRTMRDPKREWNVRLDAAKHAAPYIHRRQPQDIIVQADVQIEGIHITVLGK